MWISGKTKAKVADSPFPPLLIESLDLDAQPEIALVIAREGLESRLEWIASYLAPNERRSGTNAALAALEKQSNFDSNTIRALGEVLKATDPITHGRSVHSSVAAVVAESACRVAAALDEMITHLQSTIRTMHPRRKLAYEFLALPSVKRRTIAMRAGLLRDSDRKLDRLHFARAIFARAVECNLVQQLWIETAKESNELQPTPPIELEL